MAADLAGNSYNTQLKVNRAGEGMLAKSWQILKFGLIGLSADLATIHQSSNSEHADVDLDG